MNQPIVLDDHQQDRRLQHSGVGEVHTDTQWTDYIVYVDESGDHSLTSIDPDYPVFVLAFCVFHKRHYAESVTTALTQFKFRHFGHDMQVLHEHDIRKEKKGFNFANRAVKNAFLSELGQLIKRNNFVIISVAIDKQRLADRYSTPENPYHIALKFCLERLYFFLREKQQQALLTSIIVENRGKKEDAELALAFHRIRNKENLHNLVLPFEWVFADKRVNSAGLQLADLVVRPIGLKVIRPQQANQAFAILETKLYSKNSRQGAGSGYEGYGLKCFP